MERQKVYIETSVISNLTARPASNIADAARQCPEICTPQMLQEGEIS